MKLSVITFNIRCCDDPEGHSIKERAPRIYESTTTYDADVICFQEYRPCWEKYIEKYYGDKFGMKINVAEHGAMAVALGGGIAMGNSDLLKKVTLSIR